MVEANSIITVEERSKQQGLISIVNLPIQPDMKTPPAMYTMVSESCKKGKDYLRGAHHFRIVATSVS